MSEYLGAEGFTNGKDGELQFLIDGKVIPILGATKFKAATTPKVASRGQIGTRTKQSKITGFENKIAMTADYYLITEIRKLLINQKRTGAWPKVDMMAVNFDKGTGMGRMCTLYKDLVLTDEVPLQILDEAVDDGLTLELNFVFSYWDSLDEFGKPVHTGKE